MIFIKQKVKGIKLQKIHPLCSVRGVPGTHDIDLGIRTINNLLKAKPSTITYIPSFSKIQDKHFPKKIGRNIRAGLILFLMHGVVVPNLYPRINGDHL